MDSKNTAGPASLKASSVLLVGGQPAERSRLRAALGKHVALVDSAENALKAKRLMTRCEFEFLVVDGGLEDIPALDWIDRLRREGAAQSIVLALETADSAAVLEAMRRGAADVLERPIVAEELLSALQRHAAGPAARTPTRLPDPGATEARERELVGDSAPMRQVRDLVRRIAPLPGTVLIEGETGTGKELVARWLHTCSTRRGEFVAVNCGAIAPELLESELFGHTKGAFTSAHQGREGLFVAAKGGTLYLDEVSEMPFSLQVKLLRVIQERTIRAVGSDREIPVDARIVASTQHDLLELVRERRFREDLYFRLNVAQVNLPPLRDRLDDIATLARHFMGVLSARLGVEPLALDTRAVARLQDHDWRGNVRELKNFVERSLMLGTLATEQLVPADQEAPRPVAEYPLDWTLEEVKEHHMARVLSALGGNKSAAARRLGISRKTLERRMQLGPGNTESA